MTGMAALLAGSHASIAGSQIGDFVKAAMATQIGNDRDSAARKHGRMFGGYGYLIRTKNATLPGTAWASGWGGPRTGWYYSSDRMVLVLSPAERRGCRMCMSLPRTGLPSKLRPEPD
ncbi:hypothetical protein [Acidovorax sp. T1]|uniref:hypothetical protein n=1 Tax=Acidovorax sp. T1 TaxID=1858609 RepID=UPI0012F78EC0|nr:hypothetical protein [Acidovorax sp. T1]